MKINLYKVGCSGPSYSEWRYIEAQTKKEAIIKFLENTEEVWHTNVEVWELCKMENVIK